MNRNHLILFILSIFFIGCQTDNTSDIVGGKDKMLTISIADTRTSLGEKEGNTYPVYWSEGDCIAVNGTISQEAVINSENASTASFVLAEGCKLPYHITYPYCEATSAESPKVVFPAEQSYVEGSFSAESAPMCGYVASATNSTTLKHLAGVLRFAVKAGEEGDALQKIVITSATEKLAGEFSVDCQTATLTPSESATNSVTYTINETLSTTAEKVFYISLPAGETGACSIEFFDTEGEKMSASWSEKTLVAGIVREFKTITYKAKISCNLEPMGIEEDIIFFNTIYGSVKDTNGNPIEGVVVSDGLNCVQTNNFGEYTIESDLSSKKFVMVSIPSGYKALNDKNGLPIFYHRITAEEKALNICRADFRFQPISGDPNRFTLFIGADPQPRAKSSSYDRVAYHSLDICEDFYRDMRETRATITDREVYGMMLGDIVHENMSLFANYVAGLKTLNLQMFNIIGNHDHDLSATTDVEGANTYESFLGPSYYSFNIGKLHFIVLDNIIMTVVDGKLKKDTYSSGLTDEQWEWLQNDLKYIDTSTTLIVASHIPMFRLISGSDRFAQNNVKHGMDYATLLKPYKMHGWAGHTHTTFNYNYPASSIYHNFEVHTVARSTGQFWTNEYSAYGTPRGYTIVEVDGDDIEWRFKPTIYQSAYIAPQYTWTTGVPSYNYRDWNYNSEGVAIMKDSGKTLDGSYQMQVYKPGDYNDDYIYANIFLWDDKWELPKYNGVEMTRVSAKEGYDVGYKEIMDFYNAYCTRLNPVDLPGYNHTIFRIAVDSSKSSSGTVTVTDRFGNNYSTTISW